MADSIVLKEFLATLGYRVDENSQRRFLDSITHMTETVLKLGGAIGLAAAGVVAGVAKMAESGEHMRYLALRAGDTAANIDALAFSLSKLGASPQQVVSAIQSIGDSLKYNPALRSIWEGMFGTGPLTEQMQKLGNFLAHASAEQRRYYHQLFSPLGIPEEVWLALQRGPRAGVQEFNLTSKMFGFDPNLFGQQSVKFMNAARDLELSLNSIWGGLSQRFIDSLTQNFVTFNQLIKDHAQEIMRITESIGKTLLDVTADIGKAIAGIVLWFDKLTPGAKEVAEAIALIGLAFLKPGWLQAAAIAVILTKILDDYQKFQATGKSDLGIPWDKLAGVMAQIGQKLDELSKATNGWLNVWTVLEAFLAIRILGAVLKMGAAFASFFTTAATGAATTAAAIRSAFLPTFASMATWIGRLSAIGGFLWGFSPHATQSQEEEDEMLRQHGMGPESGRKGRPVGPDAPAGPVDRRANVPTPEPPDTSPGFFARAWSAFFPPAHAEETTDPRNLKMTELPDKVIDLTTHIQALNRTINDALMNADVSAVTGSLFGGGGGSGASSGGRSGVNLPGGGGKKINLNDPQAMADVRYLMGKGVPMMDAIALVSTAFEESSLDSKAINPKSGAYGLFQWLGDRKTGYADFAGRHGGDPTNRYTQYDYALKELRENEKTAGDAYRAATNLSDKISILVSQFERPGASEIAGSLQRGIGAGASLMSQNPYSVAGNSDSSTNVTQTNTVTIHAPSGDANDIMQSFDEAQRRHWYDIKRNTGSAFQ